MNKLYSQGDRNKRKIKKRITYCETFNVNLCKTCFKYFHVTPDIASEKKSSARKFKKEHADMLKNREIFQKNKYE